MIDLAEPYAAREADWRVGAIVYQVLVDRFAPSADLKAKRALYPAPRRMRRWTEPARAGRYLDEHHLWSQEVEFWGGDLASLRSRLDHVQDLGADVLYLNPICLAFTNHKYDALDYAEVSPEYGTRDDVRALAEDLHRRGMRLVLDGVFNHMGRRAPRFQQALHDPASPWRDWFAFGPQFPGGARSWWGAQNLPELNLEHPMVREHLFGAPDSVVRGWLRDGVDGWRLDVAYDIGPAVLRQLTDAAHAEKPGSLVVGEIPNFPGGWFPSVDGVMHFGLRRILIELANGRLDAPAAGRMIGRVIDDADFEHLLKSWIYLDNHDTPRLATTIPDERRRRLAQVLQFTLPGSPNLYYGSEVGMEGGDDPEMRGPMRWDRVAAGHPQLAWTRRLAALRREHRALRVGDFRTFEAQRLFVFQRHTDHAREGVVVAVNAADHEITELVMVTDPMLMDGSHLVDLLDQAPPASVQGMLMKVTVPAHTALVLQHRAVRTDGYDTYKRVR